jgi:two-component system copper resistance phosphate regulon response regulator CusR
MRILLVEDEAKLKTIVERGLRGEGFAVDPAETLEQGLEYIRAFHYDLAILDLLLPDGSGATLLKHIRERSKSLPVLMLTARSDIESKTLTFQAGADDYLTKPFSMAELILRVQALLRRGSIAQVDEIHIQDLVLNRITRQVRRGGKRLELSPKEYSLLEYLMLHAGRTLSRSMIVERVWDQSFEGFTNIVDVYVGHLRRKVDEGFDMKLIRTVRGMGYCIQSCNDS